LSSLQSHRRNSHGGLKIEPGCGLALVAVVQDALHGDILSSQDADQAADMVVVGVAGHHDFQLVNSLLTEIGHHRRTCSREAAVDEDIKTVWILNQGCIPLPYINERNPHCAGRRAEDSCRIDEPPQQADKQNTQPGTLQRNDY
jgi:hypothetical protein